MQQAIVITGGGQRVGLALAKWAKAQGYDVIVSYRTERCGVSELKERGVHCIQADFSEQRGIDHFISEVKGRCSSIRALIHNASEWLAESPELEPEHTLQRMMQIHAMVPYQLNLAFAELLKLQQGMADIIHVTDYVATTGSPRHIAYAASKAALENLSASFATLLAPQVKVNSIAPGLLMFNEGDDDAFKAKAISKSLLKVEPGSTVFIETIEYILKCNYLTGRCIHLDGGRHLASRV